MRANKKTNRRLDRSATFIETFLVAADDQRCQIAIFESHSRNIFYDIRMFNRTLVCLRKAQITIPQLSPTHSRAKIVKWLIDTSSTTSSVESYDPLFVLQCSPDVVTEAYRKHKEHEPLMIVEAHDEGKVSLKNDIEMDKWYDAGTVLGEIDDGDDDVDEDGEWLWQAYSHDEDAKENEKE